MVWLAERRLCECASLADQMQHQFAAMSWGAVLEQVNGLPGAEHGLAVVNRDRQTASGSVPT